MRVLISRKLHEHYFEYFFLGMMFQRVSNHLPININWLDVCGIFNEILMEFLMKVFSPHLPTDAKMRINNKIHFTKFSADFQRGWVFVVKYNICKTILNPSTCHLASTFTLADIDKFSYIISIICRSYNFSIVKLDGDEISFSIFFLNGKLIGSWWTSLWGLRKDFSLFSQSLGPLIFNKRKASENNICTIIV